MDIKKLAPWNWFKKEDGDSGHAIPVKSNKNKVSNSLSPHSSSIFQDEMDKLFDSFFNGFGLSPFKSRSRRLEGITGSILKPRLDLGATDNEYTVSVEIPGVSEKEVSLELINDTLVIRGEKKQEKEEKNKNFYRLERSYGSFQRVLSLPEDADQEDVKATFNKGVLTIKMSRKALPKSDVKQIEIR